MATIHNIEGMTADDINREIARGGKFVVDKYAVSILVMTFQQPTAIYFIKGGESGMKHSIGPTLLTLTLGWWGIPWGPIYSIGSLVTNLSGGKDVTQEVIRSINASAQQESTQG